MRFTSVRFLVYTIALAVPAGAQPPTPMSSEMSHLEVSVGADAMFAGAGADLERQMVQLGLQSRDGRLQYPLTENPNVVPGVFAQVNVAATRHAMVGFYIGADQTTTTGRTPAGSEMWARVNVKTRAALVSYRPTPWLKIGAGPALIHRLLEFQETALSFSGNKPGWLAAADAKFARRPLTPEHPPAFGYVTAQYRDAPGLTVPATRVPLYGSEPRYAAWPPERVRMSHWMIGLGVGFEI